MRRLLTVLTLGFLACTDGAPGPTSVSAPLEVCSVPSLPAPSDGRIVWARCEGATASTPAHLLVLGCIDCDDAVYDESGTLLNGADLDIIPTTWMSRIGAVWNGRIVVYAPGGVASHQALPGTLSQLMALGFAAVNANHPLPGHPGIPVDILYDPHELHAAQVRTGRVLREVFGAAFGQVEGLYGFGVSRGMGAGMGLLLADPDSPYDGYVVGLLGSGYADFINLERRIWESPEQRQPCTGLITRVSGMSAEELAAYLAPSIRVGDPGYTGSPLEYEAPSAPGFVPDNWEAITMGVDLQRPTIELQGLRDRVLPPLLTLRHAVQIVSAGGADDYRLYLLQTRGHGYAPLPIATPNTPNESFRDALLHLDTRVQSGTWPADDAITERLASEAPELAARSQVSCQALLPDASWDRSSCAADPYKWDKKELEACPDPDHEKVRSCAPWACFFAVRDGP